MITIEKGVPMPPHKTKPEKYPFTTMEVGDSFALDSLDKHAQQKLQSAASQAGKRHNMIFAVRRTETAVRCWRIE